MAGEDILAEVTSGLWHHPLRKHRKRKDTLAAKPNVMRRSPDGSIFLVADATTVSRMDARTWETVSWTGNAIHDVVFAKM